MHAFHVTSSLNRASITQHGLDWNRMGVRPGIAGSSTPEVAGVYLCLDEFEADWFVRLNNTCGPVDVWRVDSVDEASLIDNGSGHSYLGETIPPSQLTLLRHDIPQVLKAE